MKGKREDKKISKGKKHLEEMRDIDSYIHSLKIQIQTEEDMLTDISVRYKDILVQTSKSNMMDEKFAHIATLIHELNDQVKELEEKKIITLRILKKIEKKEWKQLLLTYYVQNKTLENTAEIMDKSYTWTWNEMQKAVDEFSRLFGENY